jgi:hypothetical protein
MGRLLSVVEDLVPSFPLLLSWCLGLLFLAALYGSIGEVYEDITACCNDCSLWESPDIFLISLSCR